MIHRTLSWGKPSFQFFVLNDLDVAIYKKESRKFSGNLKNDRLWLYASGARTSYASLTRKPISTEWEKDPEVRMAIIQLRILNGEVHFQDDDLEDLEKFIKGMGVVQFQRLFQTIVQSRESAQEYQDSILAQVVSKVAESEQEKEQEEPAQFVSKVAESEQKKEQEEPAQFSKVSYSQLLPTDSPVKLYGLFH